MKDVSNSTLTLIVVLAIAVSIFGTFMSLSKLSQLSEASRITGYASTGTGTANITIAASADIYIEDSLINFGTMTVNTSNSSKTREDWFRIKNEGSDPLDIEVHDGSDDQGPTSVYSGNAGMGPFQSNTSVTNGCVNVTGVDGNRTHTCFRIHCFNVSGSGDCVIGPGATIALPNTTGTSFANEVPITDPDDYVFFGVNITVPIDEPSYSGRALEQTITFTASAD